ncbi:glycosyltransferase [Kosakonia sp. BK9b]
MQNSAPLLSVVVAVYNGEAFLDQFFTCLVNQRIESMEVIIVNDGSTDGSMAIVEKWRSQLPQLQVIEQANQGVSIARNTGLAVATGQYLSFPDIDDVFKPGMFQRLLDMAQDGDLDVATCNGNYVWENDKKPTRPIFPPEALQSTGVMRGPDWLKKALDSRKFLHVTWLNIYRHDFIKQHGFRFEPGLRHQDIPWTTEVLLAAERVQYTSERFYDYYIHSASVSHMPDNDDTLIRSARHYMKILQMLDAINQRYSDEAKQIPACYWQIAKEGLGIIHTFDNMQDEQKKALIIREFFDTGVWALIWKNAKTLRLRWRLGRRYFRLKRYLA